MPLSKPVSKGGLTAAEYHTARSLPEYETGGKQRRKKKREEQEGIRSNQITGAEYNTARSLPEYETGGKQRRKQDEPHKAGQPHRSATPQHISRTTARECYAATPERYTVPQKQHCGVTCCKHGQCNRSHRYRNPESRTLD